ncbi:phage tail tube protein [Streptomyces sp. NPDC056188]|uniref:phage tail tube protein n=1 Tax=Streptomyces sp. NPDC056188 TaxID=3345740 RepID=UPI0035E0D975
MTTPAPPEETVTALARRYRCELDMGTGGTAEFALIPGITNFTPKVDPTYQELKPYETDGWTENVATMLKWSLEATLLHRAHPETGAFNPVQEALRKAAVRFGSGSYVRVRYYDRNGADDAYEGLALVKWEPDGGDADAVDTVKVTFTGSGPLTEIANPAAGGAGVQTLSKTTTGGKA